MKSYWDSLAEQFQHQQPPLRPCAEDVRTLHRIVHQWHRRHASPRTKVLLFGVTPEIADLAWPSGTFLTAVEKSQAMMDVVWPGDIPDQRQVVRGDWFDVQVKENSLDFIVGDGCLTSFAYPQQYIEIAENISRWLQPEGLMIVRLFVRTDRRETLSAILADLASNRIGRFDILKWRLAMALQESTAQGVSVGDVYRAWCQIEKEFPSLPEQAGWPRPNVNTIKLYAGRDERYTFPTVGEINDAFASCLEPVSVTFPAYDFGECCPVLVYRRRTATHVKTGC